MKISCQSCQAKYTIADEKVVGKVVKIRCKKCGATIVVNGNDPDAAAAGGGGGGDYAGGGDDQWTVNVAEGDQRTMTSAEIIREYKAGVVNEETYCWKDGMNDWLPLREIEQLYQAVTVGAPPAMQGGGEYTPLSLGASPPEADAGGGGGFGLFGGSNGGAEHTDVNGSAGLFGGASSNQSPSASTAAARRAGGRQTGNADLFGTAAQAGGENDVMTSAAGAGGASAAAATGDSKMTGARNENSVLFSLSALTNEPAQTEKKSETTAQGDGSGLIDIRALASSMGVDKQQGGNAKVDDIMNLSGGGAFSAALAAPVLAPPPQDTGFMGGVGAVDDEKKPNKTMLIGLIAGGGILGLCVIAAAIIFSGGKSDKDVKTEPTSPTTSTTAQTAPEATAAPTNTQGSGSTTEATPPSTGSNDKPEKTTGSSGGAKTGSKSTGGGTPVAAADKTPDTPPAAPAAPSKPKSLTEAMGDAVGAPKTAEKPAAAQASGAPFDRGAALAALSGVNVQSCKKPDGPTGGGKVRVTFEPNGSVSKVEFSEGPFGGTPVGGCILGKFRGARVPAFSGAAVTAAKSFVVN